MFLGIRARLVLKADKLTANCEPIVLQVSMACYGDSFFLLYETHISDRM
jgi:hypothetical protein